MEKLARSIAWAEIRGRDKGLRGPSSVWLAIWIVSVAFRYLRKFFGEEPIVVREELKPGQQLVVTHFEKGAAPVIEKMSRRDRRKAK